MKVGNFNINDYLEKLYEEAGEGQLPDKEGMIIPDENKKSYDWLKREYQKGKTEVKVEINMGGAKFEPGYDLQTDLKSVKDFKPGMYGEIKTADTESKTDEKKPSLDTKKDSGSFTKNEGEPEKKDVPDKTKDNKEDINNKEGEEKKEEKEDEKKEKSEEKPEVKKIDLKTKKK